MASEKTIHVRAAVVQAAPVAFDRERTLDKVAALTADAAAEGAQLVVFPEAFVSAYPRGLSFGAVVGDRTREGREEFRRYSESAWSPRSGRGHSRRDRGAVRRPSGYRRGRARRRHAVLHGTLLCA